MMNETTNAEIQIIVKSSVENDNEELLSIIKACLERDYVFRTKFNGRKIIMDQEVINE